MGDIVRVFVSVSVFEFVFEGGWRERVAARAHPIDPPSGDDETAHAWQG